MREGAFQTQEIEAEVHGGSPSPASRGIASRPQSPSPVSVALNGRGGGGGGKAGGGYFVADPLRGSQGLHEGPLGTRKWLYVTPFGFSFSHKS